MKTSANILHELLHCFDEKRIGHFSNTRLQQQTIPSVRGTEMWVFDRLA